ncbi:esterase/lipase family protein [Streptacidiphilus cavernicola]|uniref:Esterase/lipase family protein n=1 Tax=Streptacidiphilus cavernicola TaxID=3342716 RepID=A0ABV6VTN6_9ACTN
MGTLFRRAATTARALSQETAALAEHLLRYPTGIAGESWPLPAPDCDHDAHRPVLLLHGLFDNQAVFARMRRALAADGYAHVHALNYNPLTVDVRGAAELLDRHVRHVREVYGGERVAVVGHSLGGLIARYHVQLLGGDESVHTVVTLGAPHEGTLAARLLRPLPVAGQLLPGSSVLEELRAPAAHCRTRFLAFRGDHDALILPNGHGALRHPDLWTENILVTATGHVALPVHRDVIARIGAALAEAPAGTAVGIERISA